MLGQQVPDVYDISTQIRTHEDFNKSLPGNYDLINFHNKWTHCKTKLGAPLLFSELSKEEMTGIVFFRLVSSLAARVPPPDVVKIVVKGVLRPRAEKQKVRKFSNHRTFSGANINNGLDKIVVLTGLNVHIYRATTAKTHIFVFRLHAL